MPTYEYECTHCGHSFERFQKITDQALDKCPKCEKKVRRLIGSGAGIIFKGTGFYATDYRKSSAPSSEKSATPCQKGDGCKTCPHSK